MTDTVKDLVFDDILAALALPDGLGAPYFFDITPECIVQAEVGIPELELGPFPLVVVAGLSSKPLKRLNAGAGLYITELMAFEVQATPGVVVDVQKTLRRLEADIRVAVLRDPYRGGRAFDTTWVGTEFFYPLTTEDMGQVFLSFEVEFQVRQDDLTSSIPG
jgi:hypothetical protein